MSLLVNLLGWSGAALLLIGYGLLSSSRISGSALPYQLINLVGAAGLMINTAYYSAWPSAILNMVWALIGVAAISKIASSRRERHAAAGAAASGPVTRIAEPAMAEAGRPCLP
jgi:hypothetical protein